MCYLLCFRNCVYWLSSLVFIGALWKISLPLLLFFLPKSWIKIAFFLFLLHNCFHRPNEHARITKLEARIKELFLLLYKTPEGRVTQLWNGRRHKIKISAVSTFLDSPMCEGLVKLKKDSILKISLPLLLFFLPKSWIKIAFFFYSCYITVFAVPTSMHA